jgi:hypothetical protein
VSRVTKKVTYTDGSYFCNVCDSPHEGESLAEACYDDCLVEAVICEECGDPLTKEGDVHEHKVDGSLRCKRCIRNQHPEWN